MALGQLSEPSRGSIAGGTTARPRRGSPGAHPGPRRRSTEASGVPGGLTTYWNREGRKATRRSWALARHNSTLGKQL